MPLYLGIQINSTACLLARMFGWLWHFRDKLDAEVVFYNDVRAVMLSELYAFSDGLLSYNKLSS